jgi:hypothetical protein
MSVRAAELLAESFAKGKYPPSVLDDCSSAITLDQGPQFIRYTEFTLFADRDLRPPRWPGYLIAQPQVVARTTTSEHRLIRDLQIKPAVERALSELPTARLPAPDAKVSDIREGLKGLAAQLDRDGGQIARARSRVAKIEVSRDFPSADLPDKELRREYRKWLPREETRLIRASFEPFVTYGLVPEVVGAQFPSCDFDSVIDYLAQVFYPDPYQVFHSPHPHVAICATCRILKAFYIRKKSLILKHLASAKFTKINHHK